MLKHSIQITVNGDSYALEVESREFLSEILRDKLFMTGTKESCSVGDCGSCTVIINGLAVRSCLILAVEADGKEITTIEGIASRDGELHTIQKKLSECGAIQCGFCTPGMVLTAKALLDRNPSPSEQDIKDAISGNICRCTGYTKIIEGISEAAEEMKRGRG